MKNEFRTGKLKVMSLLLAMLITIEMIANPLCIKAEEIYSEVFVDGVTYKISTYFKEGQKHIVVRQSNKRDYVELSFEKENNLLIKEEHHYKGKDFLGQDKYSLSVKRAIMDDDLSETNNIDTYSITWNSKTYEKWKRDYWYTKGNEGTAIKEMVDAYTAYKNVKDYYIDARSCGKKL